MATPKSTMGMTGLTRLFEKKAMAVVDEVISMADDARCDGCTIQCHAPYVYRATLSTLRFGINIFSN